MITDKTECNNPLFGRILTAMVTPFTENGDVDYELAIKLSNYLFKNGSDGIVLCGTTGESPTLSWAEQHDLFIAVKGSLDASCKVIVGTGSNCTSEAVEATKKAYDSGADGALVVVPYYNKPPQEGLYNHFSSIAKSAKDLPLISIKAASGRIEEVTELRAICGSELSVYSGDDSLLLPMLSVGAVGVVSVASHLVGLQLKEMIHSFQSGKVSNALAIHEKLQPLFKALFMTTNPIPIKAALELSGWDVGNPRSPLSPLTNDMKKQLSFILNSL